MDMKVENVIIRDNGVRTFVPPCFNWELVDQNGVVVNVVSQIVIKTTGDCSENTIYGIADQNLLTTGVVLPYVVDLLRNNVEGLRYEIDSMDSTKAKSGKDGHY